MNVNSTIASAAPREGMNDLYQKINRYVYEIRMMELDEYLHGMNRKKIDKEKAYDIIINAHDSDSNPLMLYWKARLADPHSLPYYISTRVEKNERRANDLYRRAVDLNIERMAEDGDKYAIACLGWMYQFGSGVDKNCSIAIKWYRKAAEQGHADAQFNIGCMYQYGDGVDRNYSTAVEWYRRAAEQGHADAQFNIGCMYQFGEGVDKNYSTAVQWYRKAAAQGHADAQLNVGAMYYDGFGVNQNNSTAVQWYRKAAEQGHADAQYRVGLMYERGHGVDKNISTALEWYHKSGATSS